MTNNENWERRRHEPGANLSTWNRRGSPAPAQGGAGRERQGKGGHGGGPAPGEIMQFLAAIADDQSGATCGGCIATISRAHREVGSPCGRPHEMHAHSVVNAVRRDGAQPSRFCGEREFTVRHGRREALEEAAQADPCLRAP